MLTFDPFDIELPSAIEQDQLAELLDTSPHTIERALPENGGDR